MDRRHRRNSNRGGDDGGAALIALVITLGIALVGLILWLLKEMYLAIKECCHKMQQRRSGRTKLFELFLEKNPKCRICLEDAKFVCTPWNISVCKRCGDMLKIPFEGSTPIENGSKFCVKDELTKQMAESFGTLSKEEHNYGHYELKDDVGNEVDITRTEIPPIKKEFTAISDDVVRRFIDVVYSKGPFAGDAVAYIEGVYLEV